MSPYELDEFTKTVHDYPVGSRLLVAEMQRHHDEIYFWKPVEAFVLDRTASGYTKVALLFASCPAEWYCPGSGPKVIEELPAE
jgi:hypothetical protein